MKAAKGIISVRSAREAIPNLTVLWSSGSTWHRARAEAYHFEELETPQFQTADHTLVVHLSNPALVELKTDSQCDTRKRVPGPGQGDY